MRSAKWGVGVLSLLETVFPPIPSEVVLPMAGYLAQRADMDLITVGDVAATIGGYLGALLFVLARSNSR